MTSERARRLASLLLTVCLASLPQVRAQADAQTDESPAYRALVDQALGEYEATNFAEARALFARAHALYPNARVLRGLGMVEFELRNYGASIEHLEAALASPERRLTGALRERTEQLLARARDFVAHVSLQVSPASARVLVDGVRAALPADGVLVLAVGDHLLEVQADGYLSERRALRLRGGEELALRIVLGVPGLAHASSAMDKTHPWPWVLIGVSGALTATAASLLIVGKQQEADVEDAKRGVRWSEIDDEYHRATVFNTTAFALGGVGLAGLAGGMIWQLVRRDAREAPSVQLSGSRHGIQVGGRF